MKPERKQLLLRIQELDFALYELQLYLDTHPHCPHALRQYEALQRRKQHAMEQYRQQYPPITADQAATTGTWSWIEQPWPWEQEA